MKTALFVAGFAPTIVGGAVLVGIPQMLVIGGLSLMFLVGIIKISEIILALAAYLFWRLLYRALSGGWHEPTPPKGEINTAEWQQEWDRTHLHPMK